ncbi:MAG TPA: MOSC domain-containing protein, partial [Thermoplasmata archaeon]|nr:MOSC domain-containing protein [Thermoplasmata archaeon]
MQLSLKPETPGERGLPKRSVEHVRLKHTGLEGDFNRYRHEEKHDDPAMAVLILPLEIIEEFRREGWPVRPGDFGENITSKGIPNAQYAVGRSFEVGGALVEITKPCD